MRKMQNYFGTIALAFMLCMAMLFMAGTAFAEPCVDNGNGIVQDNYSGKMWQKDPGVARDFNEAIDYALSRSLGGHSDWRPPSKDELLELSRSPCKNMMELMPFFHWSHTRSGKDDDHAWHVDLKSGEAILGKMSSRLFARAVRNIRGW